MKNIKTHLKPFVAFAITTIFLVSCSKTSNVNPNDSNIPKANQKLSNVSLSSVSESEDFEVGSTSPKTAYDVSPTGSSSGDNVTLQGNQWNMYDALIGNLS